MGVSFKRFCIPCSGGLWRSGHLTAVFNSYLHPSVCNFVSLRYLWIFPSPMLFIVLTWFSTGLQLLWKCASSKRPHLWGPIFYHCSYLWSAPLYTPNWQHPGTYIAPILVTIMDCTCQIGVRVLFSPFANYCNIILTMTILVRNSVQSFQANMLRLSESSMIEFINMKCTRILIKIDMVVGGSAGVLTIHHSQEVADAAPYPRLGVVDAQKATPSLATAPRASPRAPSLGSYSWHWRGGARGRLTRRPQTRHQTPPLLGPSPKNTLVPTLRWLNPQQHLRPSQTSSLQQGRIGKLTPKIPDMIQIRGTIHLYIDVFPSQSQIIYEGNPIRQMLFIVRGNIRSEYRLYNNHTSSCVLSPGDYFGDELLSWGLQKSGGRLPSSSATLTTLEMTEAFSLRASDLKYITDHFRDRVYSDEVMRITRYYSTTWRMWAVVIIQLAWRRYKHQRIKQQVWILVGDYSFWSAIANRLLHCGLVSIPVHSTSRMNP